MPHSVLHGASPLVQRVGDALRGALQTFLRFPAALDVLKAPWIAAGVLAVRAGPMRAYRPALDTRHGFHLVGGPAESVLNSVVWFRGEFEPVLSDVVRQSVQPGDVCVDVGANAGYFSLLLSACAGASGRVISIEASPGNVGRLQSNLQSNGWQDRVEVVGVACTDHDGDVTFHVNRRNDMHCRLELPTRREADFWLMGGASAWRAVRVPARTLDQILGERAPQVSFIKLDIEGAEHRVVPDVLTHCTHERLQVALEVKAPFIRETLEPFEQAGFHVYDLRNDYRWMLNLKRRRPRALEYAAVYRLRYMADLLLTRQPLPADLQE